MRVFLCFILLFTWGIGASAQEGRIDLKSVTLGASEAQVTARFPGITCRDRSVATAERMCTVLKETYGGAEASLSFALIGGKVSNMGARLNSRDFANVVAAMRERFGSPSSEENETVTNPMGARFDNQVLTWRRGGEVVVARHYSGSLDRASVTFVSEAAIEDFKRRSRDKSRERAKDM